jgi:hypothetical protein
MKSKPRQDFSPEPPKGDLPDIKTSAKVQRIVMFPFGRKVCPFQQPAYASSDLLQNVSSAKYPYLSDLKAMERQGLVAYSDKGLTFCKEWDAKQMCSFFQQHLPRPFQYFAESGGFDQRRLTNSDSLPYHLLKKVRQIYLIIQVPEESSDFTGKFYHDHTTGKQGNGYKSRCIVLSQHI